MHATRPLQLGPSTSVNGDGGMVRRLFLKGLSDDDMHDDASVESLFASFGLRVRSVERFGPYKERVFYRANGKRVRVRYGRRFAFLDVCPLHDDLPVGGRGGDDSESEDASDEVGVDDRRDAAFRNLVQRATRSLNGATWKGSTLRCQLATERWDEKLRREVAEEAVAAEEDDETASGVPRVAARHEKEQTDGENRVRFEDAAEVSIDRAALWAEITEAPRQWVYNYERRLREVADAKPQGTSVGQEGQDGPRKSVVERFLEQQDAARAKRREDREQKEKDSFGTVYAGTTDVRKRKHGDRGVAGEEEERLAVVDFWSDGEEDALAGSAGHGVKDKDRGIDLSRFEDSDSDEAVDMDADVEADPTDDDDSLDEDGDDDDEAEEDDGHSDGDGDDDRRGGAGRAAGEPPDDRDEEEDDEEEEDESEDESEDEAEEENPNDDDASDQFATVSKVFPNAASFYATVPLDQAQASLNAQADRVRTCLKTYRKKSRRLVAKHSHKN